MATKKKEEDAVKTDAQPIETSTTEASVTLPDASPASDVEVVAKADLEKVNLNKVADESRSMPAPKLVSNDNGTTSFTDSQVVKVTHPEFVQGAVEMDNADPTKLVRVENIETPMVTREFRVTDERLKKADIQKFMDDMKKNRPSVYKDREADLKKQLEAAPN